MNHLVHVMDRLFGTPLLLLPEKAATIAGVILARSPSDGPIVLEGMPIAPDSAAAGGDFEASRFTGSRSRESRPSALARASRGVAVVDIVGSLVNRGAWVGASSGLVSYEGIAAQIDDAVADPEVSSILLDINSPGGEATGMFGLAEKIRSARTVKPVVAVVNDVAASAAYGIASAANEVVISPTSIVGSIGVVMLHVDRTGANEKAGVVETAIYAGANKTLGMGRLTSEARAHYQALVNSFYDRFLETVAAGRGDRTTADMARATEASVFIGREAIAKGLADRVATFDQVLAELSNRPATRRAQPQGMHMSNPNTPAATTEQPVATITEAQAAARADAARAEGKAEGAKSERVRCEEILGSDAAKGRETMAAHLAFKTEMGAREAVALLEASPKATAAPVVPPVGSRAGGPEIGANGNEPAPTTAAEAVSAWDRVIERVG